MKYIVMKATLHGMEREFPIVFPDHFVHSEFVEMVKKHAGFENAVPVSAGFISSMCLTGFNGKSESLNIKSRVTDKITIPFHDYNHGIVD